MRVMPAFALCLLAFIGSPAFPAQSNPVGENMSPEEACRIEAKRGETLLAKDDKLSYDEAEAIFKKAIEAKYDCVPALVGYAQAVTLGRGYEMSFEEYSAAYEYVTRALVLDPKNARGYWVLADLMRHTGRLPAAVSLADKSIVLNQNDPWSHYVLASSLINLKPDIAVNEFKEALKLKPDWQRARLNLAATYIGIGKIREAEKQLSLLIKLNPNDVQALTNIGIVHFRMGKPEMAEEDFKKALNNDPNFPMALKGLGDVAAMKKDFETAIASYKKYLNAFPRDANVWSLLGQAQAEKKDFAAARKSYETALGLNPKDSETRKKLDALSGAVSP